MRKMPDCTGKSSHSERGTASTQGSSKGFILCFRPHGTIEKLHIVCPAGSSFWLFSSPLQPSPAASPALFFARKHHLTDLAADMAPAGSFLSSQGPDTSFLHPADVCLRNHSRIRPGTSDSSFRHSFPALSGRLAQTGPLCDSGASLLPGSGTGAACHLFIRTWHLRGHLCHHPLHLCHHDKAHL